MALSLAFRWREAMPVFMLAVNKIRSRPATNGEFKDARVVWIRDYE